MQAQYGDNYLSRRKIYKRIDHFKQKRRTSVCDEERSGRLSTSMTENNIQAVERIFRENRRMTVDDIAETLNISHGYSILL
jgi:response regulator of citrate/malate metabolism